MEHTVRKNKKNRIAMRILALLFIAVAILRIVVVISSKEKTNQVITVLLCAGCLTYGIYLLRHTFRPQAYDITYVFGDKTLTLKLHRKDKVISYGDIRELGFVVPNENMDYSVIQIYIGKEQYVIPFQSNRNVAEALYGMLKLKKEEAENHPEQREGGN